VPRIEIQQSDCLLCVARSGTVMLGFVGAAANIIVQSMDEWIGLE
jgi:hypothetical protein